MASAKHLWVLVASVAIAMALVSPALQTGFVRDEWLQIAAVRGGQGPGSMTCDDLWCFDGGSSTDVRRSVGDGWLPWWYPELRHARMRFFRPLSSAIMRWSVELFGGSAPMQDIHSLLWFFVLIVLVNSLFRLTLAPGAARLATVFFAVSGLHWEAVGRVCTLHILVAAAFGLAGLVAHIAYRTPDWRAGMPISWSKWVRRSSHTGR